MFRAGDCYLRNFLEKWAQKPAFAKSPACPDPFRINNLRVFVQEISTYSCLCNLRMQAKRKRTDSAFRTFRCPFSKSPSKNQLPHAGSKALCSLRCIQQLTGLRFTGKMPHEVPGDLSIIGIQRMRQILCARHA